jgi:hypothetical protein
MHLMHSGGGGVHTQPFTCVWCVTWCGARNVLLYIAHGSSPLCAPLLSPLLSQVTAPLWSTVVYHDEAPQLAWWCKDEGRWRRDGFSDVTVDVSNHRISFATEHVAPVTLLQNRVRPRTMHGWELGPAVDGGNSDVVRLKLHTDVGAVVVLACDEGLKLLEPSEVPPPPPPPHPHATRQAGTHAGTHAHTQIGTHSRTHSLTHARTHGRTHTHANTRT